MSLGLEPTTPADKLNKMSDGLEADAISMKEELKELTPKVVLMVDNEVLQIPVGFFNLPIQELVDDVMKNRERTNLINYLQKLYTYNIPYIRLEIETKLSTSDIDFLLCNELELTAKELCNKKKDLFLPHSIVADMILLEEK